MRYSVLAIVFLLILCLFPTNSFAGGSDFLSIQEIRDWVKSTGIPDRTYTKDYDCDDFAIDLVKQAISDNRSDEVGLYLVYRYRWGRAPALHMMNFAIKGKYLYEIEPQTGNVRPLAGYEAKLD